MEHIDDFSAYHDELLDGRYDCVDRIVLNGYFPSASKVVLSALGGDA